MKIYTDKYGNVWKGACPNPFRIDGLSISPMTDEEFIELGGTIEDDGEVLTPEQKAFRDSECCVQFRALVAEVQEKTGIDDFYGAYEDIPRLRQTEYAQQHPDEMSYYTSLFAALDGWCNKDAKKYGLGQPAWFYVCWNRQPPANKE